MTGSDNGSNASRSARARGVSSGWFAPIPLRGVVANQTPVKSAAGAALGAARKPAQISGPSFEPITLQFILDDIFCMDLSRL